jgi:hypothetical protein
MTHEKHEKAPAGINLRTPQMCSSFTGGPGDPIEWQNIPANGCTISAIAGQTWPFSLPSPINLPSPSTITIRANIGSGTYQFMVSCCPQQAAPKSVTVP